MSFHIRKPDFLLIGAQKSGTSWLWDKLNQHPGTDLPDLKEIHYFGGVENYLAGPERYYSHFSDTDPTLITGEASTSYLYDRIPYWHNSSQDITYHESLPLIPDLVSQELPEVKIIVVLRDPVYRAISAYRHWLRQEYFPPLTGLKRAATKNPKTRIIEYGFYARYLSAWTKVFSENQILMLVFERDVVANPESGLKRVYRFLNLDEDFNPPAPKRSFHRTWSWTRSAVNYYAGPIGRLLTRGRLGQFLDNTDILGRYALRKSDVQFLRSQYLPSRPELEGLLNRDLDCWDYGNKYLDS